MEIWDICGDTKELENTKLIRNSENAIDWYKLKYNLRNVEFISVCSVDNIYIIVLDLLYPNTSLCMSLLLNICKYNLEKNEYNFIKVLQYD